MGICIRELVSVFIFNYIVYLNPSSNATCAILGICFFCFLTQEHWSKFQDEYFLTLESGSSAVYRLKKNLDMSSSQNLCQRFWIDLAGLHLT